MTAELMGTLLMSSGLAFLLSLVSTPLVRRLSLRTSLLDVPNERSSHRVATPRGGGIAILGASFFVILLFSGLDTAGALLILASGVIAFFGLIDDIASLSQKPKLVVQLVAGMLVVAGGVHISELAVPGLGRVSLGYAGLALTLFWLMAVTNAFNFMDGIDGMAAIETIVCGAVYAMLSVRAGDATAAVIALAVGAAAGGFLPWNLSRSRIFMGDVGSATLGFLFAGLAVRLVERGESLIAVVLPLSPFLFDTGTTLLRRIWSRESFLTAHRTHYYQRLVVSGWSHIAVSSLWGLFAIASSFAALAFEAAGSLTRTLLLAILALVYTGLAWWIGKRSPLAPERAHG